MRREEVEAWMVPGDLLPSLGELLARPAWQDEALCREYPQVWFFPGRSVRIEAAQEVCGRCPVRLDCLDYALGEPDLQGVWGGASYRERRRLRAARGCLTGRLVRG